MLTLNKPLIANTIDAIALIGHTVGELSNLRMEQVRLGNRQLFGKGQKKLPFKSKQHRS